MWLGLIGKNIKSFVVTKTFLFFFILISQIVCVMATLSVAGMLDAVTPQPTDERGWSSKTFFVSFVKEPVNDQPQKKMFYSVYDLDDDKLIYEGTDEDEYVKALKKMGAMEHETKNTVRSYDNDITFDYQSYKVIKPKVLRFLNEYGGYLNSFQIMTKNESGSIYCIAVGGNALNWEKYRHFSKANNPIIISRNPELIGDSPLGKLNENDTITIGATEYTVVNVEESRELERVVSYIPFTSLDDSLLVRSFDTTINDDVDQKGILKLKEAISKEFSEHRLDIETPQPKPLLEKQFNNMIYVLSAIMVAAVILNVARLYAYMMSTRRKTLAVFSLCGAAKQKITLVYMSEIILTMLFSFAVGCSAFHFGLSPLIAQVFPTFTTFFTSQIYLLIFGIYMVVGTIIMTFNIVPIIKKSVNDLTK